MPAFGGLGGGSTWYPSKPYSPPSPPPKPPEQQDLDNVLKTVQQKVPTQTNQFGSVAITIFTEPTKIPIHWEQQKLIAIQNVMGGSKPAPPPPPLPPDFVGPPPPPDLKR